MHRVHLSAAGKVKRHTGHDEQTTERSLFSQFESLPGRKHWRLRADFPQMIRTINVNPPPVGFSVFPFLCPLLLTSVLRRAPAERRRVWCHWSVSASALSIKARALGRRSAESVRSEEESTCYRHRVEKEERTLPPQRREYIIYWCLKIKSHNFQRKVKIGFKANCLVRKQVPRTCCTQCSLYTVLWPFRVNLELLLLLLSYNKLAFWKNF